MKFKKLNKFWKIYISVTAALFIIILCGLSVLWFVLKDYEDSMPIHEIERIVEQFKPDQAEKLVSKLSSEFNMSSYNSKENLINFYKELAKGKELKFIKKSDEYTNQHPCYTVKAGDDKIATVKLKPQKMKSSFGFTLWEVETISDYLTTQRSTEITINAPDTALVYVNGQLLKKEHIINAATPIALLKDIKQYLSSVPNLVTYKVSGLLPNPEIKATGILGEELKLRKDSNSNILYFGFDMPQAYTDEFTNKSIEISHAYANYITNDLGFGELAKYLIKDSQIYERLKTMETYWYTNHTSVKINNEKVSDFNMYSSDCFSCNVTFDHYIYRGETEFYYPSNITLTFIKQNGTWLIGNLTIN